MGCIIVNDCSKTMDGKKKLHNKFDVIDFYSVFCDDDYLDYIFFIL